MPYQMLRDDITGRPRVDAILRLADEAIIPADPGNTDWQAYQAWLKAGNTPTEPVATAPSEAVPAK